MVTIITRRYDTLIKRIPKNYFFFISQSVDAHLQFMHFLLQDGSLYLPAKRANEIWDTLISNSDACRTDRRVSERETDGESGTQRERVSERKRETETERQRQTDRQTELI